MSYFFILGVIAGIVAGIGIFSFEPNMIWAVAGGFVITVVMGESPILAMLAYLGLEYFFRGVLTQYSAIIVGIAILITLLRMQKERSLK